LVIAAIGAGATGWDAFLYLAPTRAMRIWPWAITPLTSRVLGTVFLLGIVAVGVLLDARWSTARLMVRVRVVMMAGILVAAARAPARLAMFDGHGDPPLDPVGVAQAMRVADRLASEKLAAIYVTTLQRTLQTAAPLVARLGLEPRVEADMREVHLGEWEGGSM